MTKKTNFTQEEQQLNELKLIFADMAEKSEWSQIYQDPAVTKSNILHASIFTAPSDELYVKIVTTRLNFKSPAKQMNILDLQEIIEFLDDLIYPKKKKAVA